MVGLLLIEHVYVCLDVADMASMFYFHRTFPISGMLPLVAGQLLLPALFEREKDLVPEVASIPKVVSKTDMCHAGLETTGHALELRDEVFEPESFTHRLCAGSVTHDMHHMDMKVVIGWLICLS